jgi:hypothetical protein
MQIKGGTHNLYEQIIVGRFKRIVALKRFANVSPSRIGLESV